MFLQNAEQVVDVPAPVVDELCLRTSCPAQENPAHADKGFTRAAVGGVAVDDRADAFGKVALAAEPRGKNGVARDWSVESFGQDQLALPGDAKGVELAVQMDARHPPTFGQAVGIMKRAIVGDGDVRVSHIG